jgi:hypothetical protein
MQNEEAELAGLVYADMRTVDAGFVFFKGTCEDLFGRTLSPAEAQQFYEEASRRSHEQDA